MCHVSSRLSRSLVLLIPWLIMEHFHHIDRENRLVSLALVPFPMQGPIGLNRLPDCVTSFAEIAYPRLRPSRRLDSGETSREPPRGWPHKRKTTVSWRVLNPDPCPLHPGDYGLASCFGACLAGDSAGVCGAAGGCGNADWPLAALPSGG